MARLEGKVAIVTGAGSSGPGVGVGKAIATLFAREGAAVVLVDINETAVTETLAAIEAEGGTASVHLADVSKSEDCAAAIETAVSRYGRLTTLVNNAAITSWSNLADSTEADWDRVMSVNLKSVMMITRDALPQIERAGGGSVINISSTAALRAYPMQSAYTASKGGMQALTSVWAIEQGRKNIRFNSICPGSLHTPMAVGLFSMSDEERVRRANLTALGTEGTAWDIGWAAVFLASDESRWITGVTIPVDGGMIAGTPLWGAIISQEARDTERTE